MLVSCFFSYFEFCASACLMVALQIQNLRSQLGVGASARRFQQLAQNWCWSFLSCLDHQPTIYSQAAQRSEQLAGQYTSVSRHPICFSLSHMMVCLVADTCPSSTQGKFFWGSQTLWLFLISVQPRPASAARQRGRSTDRGQWIWSPILPSTCRQSRGRVCPASSLWTFKLQRRRERQLRPQRGRPPRRSVADALNVWKIWRWFDELVGGKQICCNVFEARTGEGYQEQQEGAEEAVSQVPSGEGTNKRQHQLPSDTWRNFRGR